ncbi:MAG: HAD-IG family 5'-nucleotidase [Bacteriovoracaceae bacterium]|jgi:HAD superfamily 5'-nucleotidase-like hydrolase|nr:HAD-IG family 5'-nucleotidase [Bacteriovoracaceae bacterium]
MAIYVNRVLNMKQIKVIGFDMDHTLVRYHSDTFEELTFNEAIKKLKNDLDYPVDIDHFSFNFKDAIRGLVVDKENGNILKVSLYNKIKNSYHGSKKLNYKEQQKTYLGSSIDLGDPRYLSVDTNFSIAFTIIFSQLVDLKDKKPQLELPSYAELADHALYAVDIAHRDGSLKEEVKANLEKYIIKDEKIVKALERFKKYGKKLWIVTNSGYAYTKALLDYTINPFLKEHQDWTELFEVTVTLAAKPRFFSDKLSFLKVDEKTGMLENYDKKVIPGIYQGGYAPKLQKDMGYLGSEILYLGDHIYGDILKLKKTCDWRTALVIEELDSEVKAYKDTKYISIEIDKLMEKKTALEAELDDLYAKEHELNEQIDKTIVNKKFDEVVAIDKELAKHIKEYESHFNEKWGEVMRAGAEPSVYAHQIEKYACIYMNNIADFYDHSPRMYFRPSKRKLAHEI